MWLEHAGRRGQRLDLVGEESGHGRTGAAIRHVQELDAGGVGEHLHRHMQRPVRAGRAIRDLARSLLGVVHQFLQRFPRRVRRHPEHGGVGEHARDGRELRDLVGGRPSEQPLRLGEHGEGGERHQDRVAVGLGLGDGGVADGAAGAAAVLDDDRLAEDLLEGRRDRPRREVCLAARRERHHHGDIARGPAPLAPCGRHETAARESGQRERAFQEMTAVHGVAPIPAR